jgi:hypothetical protein
MCKLLYKFVKIILPNTNFPIYIHSRYFLTNMCRFLQICEKLILTNDNFPILHICICEIFRKICVIFLQICEKLILPNVCKYCGSVSSV